MRLHRVWYRIAKLAIWHSNEYLYKAIQDCTDTPTWLFGHVLAWYGNL